MPFDLRCVRHATAYGLHADTVPSLQLYEDGTWYCFGACRAGGSVFDFGARALGMGTTGQDFLELRERLVSALLSPEEIPGRGGRL